MTRWGLILLIGYIAIGLAGLEHARAVKLAVWLTAAIIILVGVRTSV